MSGAKIIVLLCLLTAVVGLNSTCLQNRLSDVKAKKTPVRGVNLGSWFLAESWMVGNLWSDNGCDANAAPGQYLLEQCLGANAASVMQAHWSTFITEDDFEQMASQGLNSVRLPLGWWQIYDIMGPQGATGTPVNPSNFLVGSLQYVDLAFQWAEKWGIGIMMDMHAAPGSQNGNDHSAASNPGHRYFDLYQSNIDQALASLNLFMQRYGNSTAFLGFCLLNEPGVTDNTPYNIPNLQQYYVSGYNIIRNYSTNGIVVINPLISPFESGTEDHWVNFMSGPGYNDVHMSLHYYHCFGGVGSTDDDKIAYVTQQRKANILYYNSVNSKPMVIDEWSNCGVSYGVTFELAAAQLEAFSYATGGWQFWSWKTTPNNNPYWALRDSFAQGWFAANATGLTTCHDAQLPPPISSTPSPWVTHPNPSSQVTPSTYTSSTPLVPDRKCLDQRLNAAKNYTAPLRSSGLGGWLVVDAYFTPNLWNDNGCSTNDNGNLNLQHCLGASAASVFANHYSSFVTEYDFQKMSLLGLNAVKIPVGWWTIYDLIGGASNGSPGVGDTDYITGSLVYLDSAFDWAEKWGVGIILDLHVAPGGQNNNFGGGVYWAPYSNNVDRTTDSLQRYLQRYANRTSFLGLNPLDTPDGGTDWGVLQGYLANAYNLLRSYNSKAFMTFATPGGYYDTHSWWLAAFPAPNYYNVFLSQNIYNCYGGVGDTDDAVISYVTYDRAAQFNQYNGNNQTYPSFISEWTGCGVSYQRTGEIIAAQIKTFKLAKVGWSFWSWTYVNPQTWSLQRNFDYGFVTASEIDVSPCGLVSVAPTTSSSTTSSSSTSSTTSSTTRPSTTSSTTSSSTTSSSTTSPSTTSSSTKSSSSSTASTTTRSTSSTVAPSTSAPSVYTCPASNGTTYQTTSGDVYQVTCTPSTRVNLGSYDTVELCASACSRTKGCSSVSLDNGNCYQSTSTNGPVYTIGANLLAVGLPANVAPLGCFAEPLLSRALPQQLYSNSTNSPAACAAACRQKGYQYAGTEYGAECWCGRVKPQLSAPATDCNVPCTGDASQKCGGSLRLSVTIDKSATPFAVRQSYNGYTLSHCYSDNILFRTLRNTVRITSPSSMTVATCLDACAQAGYKYCGPEYSNQCYGSNTAPSELLIASTFGNTDPIYNGCNMPCSGNWNEPCGGDARVQVYVKN